MKTCQTCAFACRSIPGCQTSPVAFTYARQTKTASISLQETKAAASAVPLFLPPYGGPSAHRPVSRINGGTVTGAFRSSLHKGNIPSSVDGSGRILLLSWSPPYTLRRLSGHLAPAFASHHCLIYTFFTIIHFSKKLSSVFFGILLLVEPGTVCQVLPAELLRRQGAVL